MSFQILQRADAPYGTAAQFPASGDSRLIYRATDTGYLYTWDASESAYKLAGIDPATVQSDISTLQTDVSAAQGNISTLQGDVATLTQGIQDAVSTHNTAPDSHADLRTLIADRALTVHQHARTDLPWITDPGVALLTAESASAQRTALGMTAWAVAPWTDGTTSDIPEGTQLYFTNARADARIAAQKGQAEGIMPLDSGGKAPLAYMPDALIGQVKFQGVWDAATNSPVLPSATTSMGHYYVTSVAGSYGGIDYGVGDWCISDGTTWGKVDNSDAITSFAGRVGAILPIASDYSSFYLGISAQAADSAKFGGQLPSYYAQAGHVHNYAGSSTPGGAATTALACTGNAATANVAKYPQFPEDAMDPAYTDISQRISSGIYEGNPDYGGVTTAKGWPINGEWTHLIAATHNNKGNYFSMQIAGHFFSQRFFARNTNNSGTTPWVELVTSGNAGTTIADNALSIGKTDGLQDALNLRAVGYPLTWFGGDGSESSPNTWTTAQFIAFLVNRGAFDHPQWSSRGQWNYVGNRVITDTGVGHVHLAGATVEVFKGTENEYMVRVTTGPATSVSGAVPKAVFIYENHGADYAPGWFRLMSAEQYPNLQAIESLSGTAGVPVKTAANTWELRNGYTGQVPIGSGTYLNFTNGILTSVIAT